MIRPAILIVTALSLIACSNANGVGETGVPDASSSSFTTQNSEGNSDQPDDDAFSELDAVAAPTGCVPYCVENQPYVCNADDIIVVGAPCGEGTHCEGGECMPGEAEVNCDEEGKACNDGNLCTKNDICTDGVCAGEPITCEDEPSAPCETSTCVEGVCQTTIDDGFCFIDGACWTEGQPNEEEPCQRCIPVVSITEWSNNDDASCGAGDADPCAPESCQGGTCVAKPIECDADTGNPCTEETCVEGVCEEVQISGGCDDGDPCTTGDVCDKGNCIGGEADCDDGLECTTEACVPGGCEVTVSAGFCLIDDACVAEGTPNPDNACQTCQSALADDTWSAIADGAPCDDQNPCTETDTCATGLCVGESPNCPDDGNPCTIPTCESGPCQIISAANGTPCDDGDPCTLGESCQAGQCVGLGANCDDGLACTDDLCTGAACTITVQSGFCVIDNACVADGTPNPDNACQTCAASQSQSAWTALADDSPCDDGNICTGVDSCVGGVCVPGDNPCPDDDDPCTTPTCENSTCDLSPAAEGTPCDDGDSCTLGDSCQAGVCTPGEATDSDNDGATAQSCGGLDCDDTNPAIFGGNTEVCDDALDNDCDGATDEDCGCATHTDCYPEKLCGSWYTTGINECSDPCAGDSDCPAGFVCSKVPGSINAGYCEPAIGIGGQGAPCTTGADCGSGLCIDSVCASGCLDQNHCTTPNHTCQMIGDFTLGFAGSACTANGGMKPSGAACSDDGLTWDSLQCASGHCDLTAPIQLPAPCSNVCTSQSDCNAGQVCGVVIHAAPPYGTITNPDAIPYHPQYTLPTYDGIAGCFTSPFGTGFGADATVCTQNNQCQTGHCLPLIPGDNTRYCTRMCSVDADCPNAGMQCKLDVVNLVSGWLEAQGTFNEGAMSLVRICKFK